MQESSAAEAPNSCKRYPNFADLWPRPHPHIGRYTAKWDSFRISGDPPASPERERLSKQPCACRGQYYYQETAHQTRVYCSRSCCSARTANAANKKRYHYRHVEPKLRKVDVLIAEFRTTRTVHDWSVLVRACDPEITSHFLTRHYKADGTRRTLNEGASHATA